jgi:hypothetical protein
VSIRFCLPNEDQSISTEEARWLTGLVLASRELTVDAAAVAGKIDRALADASTVEILALGESRALIEAFERGSTKPRSADLRRLEIALHAAVYSQTYLSDQPVTADVDASRRNRGPDEIADTAN